jgi:hypothetical protein
MKRRLFMKSAGVAPALLVPVLLPGEAAAQRGTGARTAPAIPKLEVTSPDAAAETVHRFFNEARFTALRHLGEIFQPKMGTSPGATEAGAAEFLDFLIGASPAERKKLYTNGLDSLNAAAQKKYHKNFAAITVEEADVILRPLLATWDYEPPADPLIRFVSEVHQDLRTATANSREWAEAGAASASRRRAGNTGMYFHPIP